jgi:hypothetical protein
MQGIAEIQNDLLKRVGESQDPREVLKAPEYRGLYSKISSLEPSERGAYGKAVNELKIALEAAVEARIAELEDATVESRHHGMSTRNLSSCYRPNRAHNIRLQKNLRLWWIYSPAWDSLPMSHARSMTIFICLAA